MKLSAENYIPQIIAEDLKKKAIMAWIIGFSVVFVWVFVILLAPFAAANDLQSVSNSDLYIFQLFMSSDVRSARFI